MQTKVNSQTLSQGKGCTCW